MSFSSDLASCANKCETSAKAWASCVKTSCSGSNNLINCNQNYCYDSWVSAKDCIQNCGLQNDIPEVCNKNVSKWHNCIGANCANCENDQSCFKSCFQSCESALSSAILCIHAQDCTENPNCWGY